MAARPIIIQPDPGQDDAVAILLALASPELDVLGIAAVAGNVPLTLTQTNARRLCELARRPDMKVFAGWPRPLGRAGPPPRHEGFRRLPAADGPPAGHRRGRTRQDRHGRRRPAGADHATA